VNRKAETLADIRPGIQHLYQRIIVLQRDRHAALLGYIILDQYNIKYSYFVKPKNARGRLLVSQLCIVYDNAFSNYF
jgi:hypothetical protein